MPHTIYSQSLRFQSTPPCGGDHRRFQSLRVSKHFNPRPLAGATLFSYIVGSEGLFQSTPPRGGDNCSTSCWSILIYFNPRPLAGATVRSLFFSFTSLFQSTPPRGGDFIYRAGRYRDLQFQSTPPRGGDRRLYTAISLLQDFNPRPLAGATSTVSRNWASCGVFQSTPPRGGDLPAR